MADTNRVEGLPSSSSAVSSNRLVQALKFFLKLFKGYQIFVSNSVLFLLTGGLEQLVETFTFPGSIKCPLDRTVAIWYSLAFLIGPLLVLFMLGIVLQKKTWFSFYGFSMRKKLFPPPEEDTVGKTIPIVERNWNLGEILFEASIIPLGWLFFATLDGDYVVCIASAHQNTSEEINYFKSISAAAAWAGLSFIVIFSVIVMCIVRCNKKHTYLQKQYVDMCRAKEKELTLKYMAENIETVSTRAAKFLDAHTFTDKDWVLLTRVEPIPTKEMTIAINNKKRENISMTSPLQAWIPYHEKSVE